MSPTYRALAGKFPGPSPINSPSHPPLTQDLQQDALTAVAQGVASHTLVGATVVSWVGPPDTKAELGSLRVQHESGSAWFYWLVLGSQPEELGRWHAPQKGTLQPGLSPLQHRHPGLSHCQLWGFCGDRE